MAGIWREAVIAGGLTGVSVRPEAAGDASSRFVQVTSHVQLNALDWSRRKR
jgi:hypothetical protein